MFPASRLQISGGRDNDVLFVSHAPEDWEKAAQVAQKLGPHLARARNTTVLSGQLSEMDDLEAQIGAADAVLLLVSPDFFASPRCRRERELAILHQQQLRRDFPEAQFLYVARIRPADMAPAGLPAHSEWLDLTSQASDDWAIADLAERLRGAAGAVILPLAGSGAGRFQNREQELDHVRQKIANLAGPHFWLIIGPPQLGKSWFLDRLGDSNCPPGPGQWTIRLADVRAIPAAHRDQIRPLLQFLLKSDLPSVLDQEAVRTIASHIVRSRHHHLWLIDGGDLLTEEAGKKLRGILSDIHNSVSGAGISEATLAVVIGSRRDKEWRGQLPSPRPEVLPLSGFPREVVRRAMLNLAEDMGRDPAGVPEIADSVHGLSEGLPALLGSGMAWIEHEHWLDAEALTAEPFFMELAKPYLDDLLAPENLLLSEDAPDPASGTASVLGHALRVLAPYRLFTQAYLQHHSAADEELAAEMRRAGWGLGALARAISDLALLTRPLTEPWKEIQPQVRRLLFRHYYTDQAQRQAAHVNASNYTRERFEQVNGKEQVIAMVECLWHEAARLRLQNASRFGAKLIATACDLSERLRESGLLQRDELREFAVARLSQDNEFQQTVRDQEIIDQIYQAILSP